MPRHSLTRCLNRRLCHSLTRRCSRRTVRRVGRGPRVNYLAQALTAFNRAVRARCRLARLAPEIFDSAVVSRREAEREDRRQLVAELEPILQKVYGPATDSPPQELHHSQTDEWCRNGAEMVQFSPRRIQEIESLLAEREFWMTVGTVALARHQTLQPHRHVSLGMAVRLVDLASKLGRLAAGLELHLSQKDQHPPDAFPSWRLDMAEALRRTYGGPDNTDPSPAPFNPNSEAGNHERHETHEIKTDGNPLEVEGLVPSPSAQLLVPFRVFPLFRGLDRNSGSTEPPRHCGH